MLFFRFYSVYGARYKARVLYHIIITTPAYEIALMFFGIDFLFHQRRYKIFRNNRRCLNIGRFIQITKRLCNLLRQFYWTFYKERKDLTQVPNYIMKPNRTNHEWPHRYKQSHGKMVSSIFVDNFMQSSKYVHFYVVH